MRVRYFPFKILSSISRNFLWRISDFCGEMATFWREGTAKIVHENIYSELSVATAIFSCPCNRRHLSEENCRDFCRVLAANAGYFHSSETNLYGVNILAVFIIYTCKIT